MFNGWFTNVVHLPVNVRAGWGTTMAASTIQAFALGSALLLAGMGTAHAIEGIDVVMNQAKIVKLAKPADTIVVGNPAIADASVQDATTLVLTGKGFGVTNLVVLDADGNPIVDQQIIVSRQETDSLRIYRRADIQTLSCTPYCEGAYRSPAEVASDTSLGGGDQ
jgi:Flp pilus assembly secretin CpaC